jgi:hypothetical protein
MLRSLAAGAFALAIASSVALAPAAHAQNAERVYDQGTVWQISYIETKPGMFDDYMKYLSTSWRALLEEQKKKGDVVSYKVLAVDSPRDHEPDVILMVEFKNMAVFDRPLAEGEAVTAKVFGSIPKSNQAAVARESVRMLRGGVGAREITFLK